MTDRTPAYVEALRIALKKRYEYEIHVGRWLIGFDDSFLFVVAPKDASDSTLAVLILEQLEIAYAQRSVAMAQKAIESLANAPTGGAVQ